MPADDLILFSGYARLPKGVSASFRHETLALVVLLDMKTLTIVEAECTLSTKTSEHYVAGILIGYSFNCGIEDVCRRIDQYYDGYAKKAVLTALRAIYTKLGSYRRQESEAIEAGRFSTCFEGSLTGNLLSL